MPKDIIQPEHNKLFDVVLVVELQEGMDGHNAPFVSYRYPKITGEADEKDAFSHPVTQFCFPDINQFPTEKMDAETFCFVLTEGDGGRRFGYCRRQLPSGTGDSPCFPLYDKILQHVAYHYENSSMSSLTQFVKEILQHPFPAPSQKFEVKVLGEATYFERPNDSDSQLGHVEVKDILTHLDDRNIMIIFISLLLERRIIFCSTKLSILSSCIQAAVALLYPFNWQHIYIPVLPKSLLDFVCAPMPFVVGILRSELQAVLANPMDEVLIVDIDKNEFIRIPGETEMDDLNLIPAHYTSEMRKVLKNSTKIVKKREKKRKANTLTDDTAYLMKVMKEDLTETFVKFFVSVLSGYRGFLKDLKLDTQAFIESMPEDTKPLVDQMTRSQMFECFLVERRTGVADTGFEKRIDVSEKIEEKMRSLDLQSSGNADYIASLSAGGLAGRARPSSKRNIRSGWTTLRNQFKLPTEEDSAFQIGSPTVVSSTGEIDRGDEIDNNSFAKSKEALQQFRLPDINGNSIPLRTSGEARINPPIKPRNMPQRNSKQEPLPFRLPLCSPTNPNHQGNDDNLIKAPRIPPPRRKRPLSAGENELDLSAIKDAFTNRKPSHTLPDLTSSNAPRKAAPPVPNPRGQPANRNTRGTRPLRGRGGKRGAPPPSGASDNSRLPQKVNSRGTAATGPAARGRVLPSHPVTPPKVSTKPHISPRLQESLSKLHVAPKNAYTSPKPTECPSKLNGMGVKPKGLTRRPSIPQTMIPKSQSASTVNRKITPRQKPPLTPDRRSPRPLPAAPLP